MAIDGTIRIITPKTNDTSFYSNVYSKISTNTNWSNWGSYSSITFSPTGTTRNVKIVFDASLFPSRTLEIVTPFFNYCKFYKYNGAYSISTNNYDTIVSELEQYATEINYNEISLCITDISENVTDDVSLNKQKTQFNLTPVSSTYLYYIVFPSEPVVNKSITRTFTQNLSNCTSNISQTSFNDGDTINITVTPTNGYYFDITPTLSNGVVMTESGGAYSATFNITEDVTLTAAAVEIPTVTFNQNLSNCTSNITQSTFYEGDTINITVTPVADCKFLTAPTLSNGVVMTESGGAYSATFNITTNVTLNASAFIYGALNKNVSNCTIEIFDKDNNNITNNNEWYANQTPLIFTATPDNGYYFENIPRITWFDNLSQQVTTYLTLDTTIGKYTATITPVRQYVNFNANAAVITVIYNKYGLITVYIPTLDELKEIAKARYFYETDTSSIRYYKDLGEFISKLHVVPLVFSGLRTQRLYLGNYPITNSVFPVIDDNTIIVNMGDIELNGKYNNVVDYNATAKIYLPFIGFRNLETVEIMDKCINVKYKIDVISGNAKIFISTVENVNNERIETIIETFDCIISYNIPFVNLGNIEKNFELNANYLWGLTAFVSIEYPNITGDNTTYGNANNICALIGTFTGLTSFDEITLITTATETERNEIIRLLERGVII